MALRKYCYRCGGVVDPEHVHRTPRSRTTPNDKAIAGIGPIGRAWRRERAAYLRLHPICEWKDGCLTEASHVHHIDGKGPTGERGLDHSNFMALCPSHHGQIEASRQVRDPDGRWGSSKVVRG